MGKVIDFNKVKRERMLDSAKKALIAQGVNKEVATEVTSQFKMFSEYLSSECDVNVETNDDNVVKSVIKLPFLLYCRRCLKILNLFKIQNSFVYL